MLERTFLHVPGIGEVRERRLWEAGYGDWRSFRRLHPEGAFKDHVLAWLDRSLAAGRLPRSHSWRLLPEARRVLYLDIETTGLSAGEDAVTIVGTYDGRRAHAYARGRDLERFVEAVDRAEMIVTYNGACFDLPFLAAAFPQVDLRRPMHVDLRYPLRKLGFSGGLKGIEPQLGIRRPASLRGVDGYTAVLLWRAHERGHGRALETLARYCLEDVVNLEPLMVETFNRWAATLPIEVPLLACGPRPRIDLRVDEELIDALVRR